jgi:hypothetical protein
MNPETGRRTFVRSMAVGLPALAGAAAFSPTLAAFVPRGGARPAIDAVDAHMDRTLRELAAFYNQLSGRGLTPEDARLVAPQLRSLVTYRQGSDRDMELSSAFRGLLAQEGRHRLTAVSEADLSRLTQGLQHYGVHARSVSLVSLGGLELDARSKALDTVLREGAGAFFFDAWVVIGLFVDAMVTPSFCEFVQEMTLVLEAMAALFCVAATFVPIFGPECFAASVVLAILKFINFAGSC